MLDQAVSDCVETAAYSGFANGISFYLILLPLREVEDPLAQSMLSPGLSFFLMTLLHTFGAFIRLNARWDVVPTAARINSDPFFMQHLILPSSLRLPAGRGWILALGPQDGETLRNRLLHIDRPA